MQLEELSTHSNPIAFPPPAVLQRGTKHTISWMQVQLNSARPVQRYVVQISELLLYLGLQNKKVHDIPNMYPESS